MVLSSVVLSLAVGVGKDDAVDVVGIATPEAMLEVELDAELTLVVVDEGA